MKTLRTAPFALLVLVLAVAMVGSSCSSTNPVALQVGQWQLSTKTFEEQMNSFFDAYSEAVGADQAETALKGTTSGTWNTTFTAQFLNDQLSLQLAQLAVQEKGLEVTQDDLDAARTQLEANYSTQSGESVFDTLIDSYQQALIEGIAAQMVLQKALIESATSDEGLRAIYDADPTFAEPQACVSHILVFAGQPDGRTTPSDADYAAALSGIEAAEAQLDGTANFATVATATSDDTGSASKGGDLGCSPEGTFVPEFDAAVWSQPIGQVGQPVKTIYGYHLVLVRSRGVQSFEDVKDQLIAQVEASPEALIQRELARVAAETTITVDGRYGQFDADTGQITAPAGAELPSTTTTSLDIEALLGSAGQ